MSFHSQISKTLVGDVEAAASALTGKPSARGAAPAAPAGGASSPLGSARIHLGNFDGERKRRSRGYREDYGLANALASLAVVTALIIVAALILGAF